MKKEVFKKIAAFLLAGLIIYFLAQTLYKSIGQLKTYNLKIVYWKFLLSLIFYWTSDLFIPAIWMIIFKTLKVNLSFRRAFVIWFISHLGKYIPGKIWAPAAQVYLAKKENIPVKTTLTSAAILLVVTALGGFYVFLFSFLFWTQYPLVWRIVLFLAAFLFAFSLVKFHIADRVANFGLKMMRKDVRVKLQYERIGQMYLLLGASWIMFALGYYFLVTSFFPITAKEVILIIGAHAISWLIGYAAFIVPGGLGIREGAFVYLLKPLLPLPICIIIAFVSRLWITLSEIGISFIAVLFSKTKSVKKDMQELLLEDNAGVEILNNDDIKKEI